MKRLNYLVAAIAIAFAFQGCGGGAGSATDTSDTSKMSADSMAAAMDTSSMSAAQMDIDFANKAAIGGMAEVELGKLAQEKANAANVKEFAGMMVNDHGKANEELMAIAKMKNITLPSGLDEEHTKKMDELKTKSGADFDKAYVATMVEGHQKTLALMQDAAQHCEDSDLKAFAGKTAPIVKAHLDQITKIQSGMK